MYSSENGGMYSEKPVSPAVCRILCLGFAALWNDWIRYIHHCGGTWLRGHSLGNHMNPFRATHAVSCLETSFWPCVWDQWKLYTVTCTSISKQLKLIICGFPTIGIISYHGNNNRFILKTAWKKWVTKEKRTPHLSTQFSQMFHDTKTFSSEV